MAVDNRTPLRNYPIAHEDNILRTEELPRFQELVGLIDDDVDYLYSNKADLASPTFTGVPVAPTASGGTNTTQVATTAFVKNAIDSVIASAPGLLDTLDELAAALGDDANFAATMTTALAGKQGLNSILTNISGQTIATGTVLVGNGSGTFAATATSTYERGMWNLANEAAFKAYVNLEAADILSMLAGVDGAGSGLDADLLDGNNIGTSGTAIPLLSAANTWGGQQTFNSSIKFSTTLPGSPDDYASWGLGVRYALWNSAELDSFQTSSVGSLISNIASSVRGFQIGVNHNATEIKFRSAHTTFGTGLSPWSRIWHDGNDGAGSGLDADLLDGYNIGTSGGAIPLMNANNTWSGKQIIDPSGQTDSGGVVGIGNYLYIRGYAPNIVFEDTTASATHFGMQVNANLLTIGRTNLSSTNLSSDLQINSSGQVLVAGGGLWSSGNDGAGSGLDADLLDGIEGAAFGQLAAVNTWTATNNTFNYGASGTSTLSVGGTNDQAANLQISGNAAQVQRVLFRTGTNWRWGLISDSTAESGSNAGSNFTLSAYADAGNTLLGNVFSIIRSTQVLTFGQTPKVGSDTIWHAGNDGSGSGLDADLLDGYNIGTSGGAIPLLNANNTWSGNSTFTGQIISTYTPNGGPVAVWSSASNLAANSGGNPIIGRAAYYDNTAVAYKTSISTVSGWGMLHVGPNILQFSGATGTFTAGDTITPSWNTVWHAGNDGAGSGLDADLLDGQQGSYYQTASGYTAADVLSKLLTVDGAASGLDADLLDSYDSSAFPRKAENATIAGTWVFPSLKTSISGAGTHLTIERTTTSASTATLANAANYLTWDYNATGYSWKISGTDRLVFTSSVFTYNANTIWHAGNDGAGSGLDADLLDGYNVGTSGATIPLLNAANTWSASQSVALGSALSFLQVGSSVNFGADVRINSNAGYDRRIVFMSASTNRWIMKANTTAESGSNAGSDFSLIAYNDAGTSIGSAFDVTRSTRVVNFAVDPTVASNTIWHAGNDGAGSGLDADTLDGLQGSAYLTTGTYTAADVLSKLLTVDGATSGLDADLLDGQQGSYYQAASGYTAADVLTKLLTVDGSGSLLDADLLDGLNSTAFAQLAGTSAFTAAQTISTTGTGTVLTLLSTDAGATAHNLDIYRNSASPAASDVIGQIRFLGKDSGGNVTAYARMQTIITDATDGSEDSTLYLSNTVAGSSNDALRLGTTAIFNIAPYYNSNVMWHEGNDGSGSTLDADLLDGQHGSYYQAASGYTAADVLTKLLTVDGAGSLLDADLLDGYNIGTSGGTIGLLNGNKTDSGTNTFSGANTFSNTNTFSGQLVSSYTTNTAPHIRWGTFGMVSAETSSSPIFARNLYYDTTAAAYKAFGASSGGYSAVLLTGTHPYWSGLVTTTTAGQTITPSWNIMWHAGNDGAGSTLDADLLDGQHGSYYQAASGYTAADVLSKLLTVDGAGSGLDADLLDGNNIGTSGTAIPLLSGANTWGTAQIFNSGTTVGTGAGAALLKLNGAAATWRYLTGETAGSTRWVLILGNSTGESGSNSGSNFQIKSYSDAAASLRDDLIIARSTGAWAIGGSSMTLNGNAVWNAGNDGAGSGLDADLLDGYSTGTSGGVIGLLNGNNTYSGTSLFSGVVTLTPSDGGSGGAGLIGVGEYMNISGLAPNILFTDNSSSVNPWFLHMNQGIFTIGENVSSTMTTRLAVTTSSLQYNGNTIWHAGNDGAGSGLDADLLDGNNIGTSGTAIPLLSGANTWSANNVFATSGAVTSLTIGSSIDFSSQLRLRGNAGQFKTVYFYSGSNTRWTFGADNAAESGSNAGSNFSFASYNDAGSVIGTTMSMNRATRVVNFAVDPTVSSNTIWHAGNDGSGSGLDADLLDGNNIGTSGAAIPLLNANNNHSGTNAFSGTSNSFNYGSSGATQLAVGGSNDQAAYFYLRGNAGQVRSIIWQSAGVTRWQMYASNSAESGSNAGSNFTFRSYDDAGAAIGSVYDITRSTRVLNFVVNPTSSGNTMWNAGNDGSGSGLDADLLDGLNSAAFATLASSPTFTAAGTNTIVTSQGGSGYGAFRAVGSGTNDAYIFFNNVSNGERSRITANNSRDFIVSNNGGSTNHLVLNSSGALTVSGDLTGNSDERLKENVVLIQDAMSIIRKISGVTFNRIAEPGGRRSMGVLAQQLLLAGAPELVHENSDGILSVAYGNAFGLMVEGVKDVDGRVAQLENIVAQQNARISVLEARAA